MRQLSTPLWSLGQDLRIPESGHSFYSRTLAAWPTKKFVSILSDKQMVAILNYLSLLLRQLGNSLP